MMNVREFLLRANLETVALTTWVEAGWIIPDESAGYWAFRDVDLARVQFIHDLQRDFEVNDEGIDLIVHLVDQIGGLRRTVGHIAWAISIQPEDARGQIESDFREISARSQREQAGR